MSEPDLGFVEGGYGQPTDSVLDRPLLNARQKYTHIVEDGMTQVVRGAIECELDGGTVQIGMYDITDGVVGAPRVFTQEIQLPEKPGSVGDGHEFGTHVFDLDPVPLHDYVGRELAVAVRHDRVRKRGQNWSDDFSPEYGWGYSTGERGDPLSETWQDDLYDDGQIISAALFVEPVEVPDGKVRTVVGSEIFETRSQTVFGAFPDLSPAKGMVVEYDPQTAASAPVTVLPNGVMEVGQGSAATDSVAVSIRDGDGTWHGPRTVTLTEASDSTAVTASGDTISPGGQATLSVTGKSVETVTVENLWTDWTVQVDDPAGGTVQNSVNENGTLTLTWNSVQSSAAPSLTIGPPGETYVGGTYAVDITAEDDGDGETATDTALLDIQSSSGGQIASSSQQRTSITEDTTTLVASRGPDGSRLTSRPDGPVYHTTEGTTHLFTWDELGPGARTVLYDEDDSTDWGGGPDIHLYDTMDRPDASAGDVPSRDATTGQWSHYSRSPELQPDAHSGEYSARVQNQRTINKFRARFEPTTEVFLSYCVKIPEGKAMPGTEQPGQFPELSVWKMAWLFHEDVGARDDDVDICLPSWSSGQKATVGGNNLDPSLDIVDNERPDWWQFGEWMRFSFWLECGPDPDEDPGRIRWQVVTEGEQTQVVAENTTPVMVGGQAPYAWKRLNIPGWSDNKDASGDNVEALYDDIYVATGANSNARLELSDSVEYGTNTHIQLCDIRSWSSNRVSARLRKGSLDAVEGAAIHLTTAEEQQAVSMEVN